MNNTYINMINGFLNTLGTKAKIDFKCPEAKIVTDFDGHIIVTALFGCETRFVKDVFEPNTIMYNCIFDIEREKLDAEAVRRRYIAAEHRAKDAVGKKTEKEKAEYLTGAQLALSMLS